MLDHRFNEKRLTQLKNLLEIQYEKIHEYEKAIELADGQSQKIALRQQLERNLIPELRKLEDEYALLLANQRPDQLMTSAGIPKPPQPYFAHPYPLQANFTGRVVEREMLSDWLTKDQRPVLALADLEPNILLGLAMVRSRTLSPGSKRTNEVNRLLGEALKLANRCQYRLKQADIHNFLAQIERDAGNNDAAIEAATQAYCFAWCDGPPVAYHWGLQKAKAHLTALGVPFPNMPPARQHTLT